MMRPPDDSPGGKILRMKGRSMPTITYTLPDGRLARVVHLPTVSEQLEAHYLKKRQENLAVLMDGAN